MKSKTKSLSQIYLTDSVRLCEKVSNKFKIGFSIERGSEYGKDLEQFSILIKINNPYGL